MLIDKVGYYRTRGGRKARVLCVDAPGEYPCVGYISCGDKTRDATPCSWTRSGCYVDENTHASSDIPVVWSDAPEPGEGWRLLTTEDTIQNGDEFLPKKNDVEYSAEWKSNHGLSSIGCRWNKTFVPFRRRLAPGWVDVEVKLDGEGMFVFASRLGECAISSAPDDSRFLGYVYEVNGKRVCRSAPVIYALHDSSLWLEYMDGCVALRPTAVRMRRE